MHWVTGSSLILMRNCPESPNNNSLKMSCCRITLSFPGHILPEQTKAAAADLYKKKKDQIRIFTMLITYKRYIYINVSIAALWSACGSWVCHEMRFNNFGNMSRSYIKSNTYSVKCILGWDTLSVFWSLCPHLWRTDSLASISDQCADPSIFFQLSNWGSWFGLEKIPPLIRWEAGYTLHRSPVYHKAGFSFGPQLVDRCISSDKWTVKYLP